MMIIKKKPEPKKEPVSTFDAFSAPGDVNRYGVKLIPGINGFEQWIIDAKTGKPVKRDGYECMEANGLYLWIKKGEQLRSIDGSPYPSVWNRT